MAVRTKLWVLTLVSLPIVVALVQKTSSMCNTRYTVSTGFWLDITEHAAYQGTGISTLPLLAERGSLVPDRPERSPAI